MGLRQVGREAFASFAWRKKYSVGPGFLTKLGGGRLPPLRSVRGPQSSPCSRGFGITAGVLAGALCGAPGSFQGWCGGSRCAFVNNILTHSLTHSLFFRLRSKTKWYFEGAVCTKLPRREESHGKWPGPLRGLLQRKRTFELTCECPSACGSAALRCTACSQQVCGGTMGMTACCGCSGLRRSQRRGGA